MADNILVLMTDQHSVSTLGAYGNPIVRTPALDRLAATGTRFADAFTPTAICTPARASLLTGAAPGPERLAQSGRPPGLPGLAGRPRAAAVRDHRQDPRRDAEREPRQPDGRPG